MKIDVIVKYVIVSGVIKETQTRGTLVWLPLYFVANMVEIIVDLNNQTVFTITENIKAHLYRLRKLFY